VIWGGAVKIDETTQLEMYKLFNDLASRLKLNEINYVIEQISSIAPSKIIQDHVALVHEIGKRARTGDTAYGHKAVEFMWKVVISQE